MRLGDSNICERLKFTTKRALPAWNRRSDSQNTTKLDTLKPSKTLYTSDHCKGGLDLGYLHNVCRHYLLCLQNHWDLLSALKYTTRADNWHWLILRKIVTMLRLFRIRSSHFVHLKPKLWCVCLDFSRRCSLVINQAKYPIFLSEMCIKLDVQVVYGII